MLSEANTDLLSGPPSNMAGPPKALGLYNQGEAVGYGHFRGDFEASARRRNVADDAFDAWRAAEQNRATLIGTTPLALAMFIHDTKGSGLRRSLARHIRLIC